MNTTLKKNLSIVLRLAVAAAGIAYVAYTLNWHDAVVLPAGYDVAGAVSLPHEQAFDVIAQEGDDLTIDVSALSLPIHDLTVLRDDLGSGTHEPRFKPGILTTLSGADVKLLIAGFALMAIIFPIQGFRWLILMRCRGLVVRYAKAFRLIMIGVFFNFCMPGSTGGDVVKAYYAAKGSGKRGEAVMSVVFDRISGLIGLVLLAGIVGLFMLQDELARSAVIIIWTLFAGILAVSGVYFSDRLRTRLGIDAFIARLSRFPLIQRIDETASAYRYNKLAVLGATLVSLPVHLANTFSMILAGYALGLNTPVGLLLVVLPIVVLAAAIPISYQGLGVMEGLSLAFLLDPSIATANQIVGMLLLFRIFLIMFGLLGALMMIGGDIHLHPQQASADDDSQNAKT